MEGEIIRSAADTLSLSEMQQKKVYVRRDVKTTNPRRLFRVLRNSVEEMGYVVTYNPVSIQKDAVGDTGFIDANITSKKSVTVEVPGGHTLDFHGTSDMVKYGLFGGIVFFLIGIIFELGWVVVGFMALVVGILLMIKSKEIPKKIYDTNQIWIKGEGEVYRGELSETRSKRGMQQAQIISELSISIAGESIIALDGLRKDINQLTIKLEALGE